MIKFDRNFERASLLTQIADFEDELASDFAVWSLLPSKGVEADLYAYRQIGEHARQAFEENLSELCGNKGILPAHIQNLSLRDTWETKRSFSMKYRMKDYDLYAGLKSPKSEKQTFNKLSDCFKESFEKLWGKYGELKEPGIIRVGPREMALDLNYKKNEMGLGIKNYLFIEGEEVPHWAYHGFFQDLSLTHIRENPDSFKDVVQYVERGLKTLGEYLFGEEGTLRET